MTYVVHLVLGHILTAGAQRLGASASFALAFGRRWWAGIRMKELTDWSEGGGILFNALQEFSFVGDVVWGTMSANPQIRDYEPDLLV